MNNPIIIEANIQAPIEKVWKHWNEPESIKQWNNASPDWHTPSAAVDLKPGGKFTYRMEAKDGSFGFDLEGIYHTVEYHSKIEYSLMDDRKVKVSFISEGNNTLVIESFEAENVHPRELQQTGWQAILDNFKKFVETH